MKIHIPETREAPETFLFVKLLQKAAAYKRDIIFLLPGGPGGNHSLYADIEDALFEFADLAIIDLRGCGYSDPSDIKYCTLTQHLHDIEIVRQRLEINSFILHGCSY